MDQFACCYSRLAMSIIAPLLLSLINGMIAGYRPSRKPVWRMIVRLKRSASYPLSFRPLPTITDPCEKKILSRMEAMIWAAEGLLGYAWKGYCARQRALLLIAGHGVTFLGVYKEQTFAAIGCGQPHAHLTIHREISCK